MAGNDDPYAARSGVSLSNTQNASFDITSLLSKADITPVSLTAEDGAPSRGLLYRPKNVKPKVGVHLMHPRTDHTRHYCIPPLVDAGYMVLGRNCRWPHSDVSTEHEPLLLDVAAGVRRLKEEGCEQVILLGNSGGSSLAAFYQAQARTAPAERISHTPGGSPTKLGESDLPPADGVAFVGGHAGQGIVLLRCIDPSVVDENNPLLTDPTLDMYDPDNGFVVPPQASHYDEAFLSAFRAGQAARVARIDAKAFALVEAAKEAARLKDLGKGREALNLTRAASMGWHMLIYRTAADPCFVDLSIDPDDRRVFSYFSARPDLENYGETGFSRVMTPKAWLSTWSGLQSNAISARNIAKFDDPFLIVHYAGDCGTRMADVDAMIAASPSKDKSLQVVRGADHYGFRLSRDGAAGARVSDGLEALVDWMLERFPPR